MRGYGNARDSRLRSATTFRGRARASLLTSTEVAAFCAAATRKTLTVAFVELAPRPRVVGRAHCASRHCPRAQPRRPLPAHRCLHPRRHRDVRRHLPRLRSRPRYRLQRSPRYRLQRGPRCQPSRQQRLRSPGRPHSAHREHPPGPQIGPRDSKANARMFGSNCRRNRTRTRARSERAYWGTRIFDPKSSAVWKTCVLTLKPKYMPGLSEVSLGTSLGSTSDPAG